MRDGRAEGRAYLCLFDDSRNSEQHGLAHGNRDSLAKSERLDDEQYSHSQGGEM